jgi:hypothetical protein
MGLLRVICGQREAGNMGLRFSMSSLLLLVFVLAEPVITTHQKRKILEALH